MKCENSEMDFGEMGRPLIFGKLWLTQKNETTFRSVMGEEDGDDEGYDSGSDEEEEGLLSTSSPGIPAMNLENVKRTLVITVMNLENVRKTLKAGRAKLCCTAAARLERACFCCGEIEGGSWYSQRSEPEHESGEEEVGDEVLGIKGGGDIEPCSFISEAANPT